MDGLTRVSESRSHNQVDYPFSCPKCNCHFMTESDLLAHLEVHNRKVEDWGFDAICPSMDKRSGEVLRKLDKLKELGF